MEGPLESGRRLEDLVDLKLDPQSGQLYQLSLVPVDRRGKRSAPGLPLLPVRAPGQAGPSTSLACSSCGSQTEVVVKDPRGWPCLLCADDDDPTAALFAAGLHASSHARLHSDLGQGLYEEIFRQCFPDIALPDAPPAQDPFAGVLLDDDDGPSRAQKPRREAPEESAEEAAEGEGGEGTAAEDESSQAEEESEAEDEEEAGEKADSAAEEPSAEELSDDEEELAEPAQTPSQPSQPSQASALDTTLAPALNATMAPSLDATLAPAPALNATLAPAPALNATLAPAPALNATLAAPAAGAEKSEAVMQMLKKVSGRLDKRTSGERTHRCQAPGCTMEGAWAVGPSRKQLEEHVASHLTPEERSNIAQCPRCGATALSVSRTTCKDLNCAAAAVTDLRQRVEGRYIDVLSKIAPEIKRELPTPAAAKAQDPNVSELDSYLRKVILAFRASKESLRCALGKTQLLVRDQDKLVNHLCSELDGLKLWRCRACGFDAARRDLKAHTFKAHDKDLPKEVEEDWENLRGSHETKLLGQLAVCFPHAVLDQHLAQA